MTMKKSDGWAVLFDLDETLVLTSRLEPLRRTRRWKEVYGAFPETRLPDGTADFLERVRQKAKMGVVTKSPRAYAEKLLAHHNIEVPVLAAYHDVKNVKPDPEALLLAARKLELEPHRCIYVGDDASDVQAAKAAKCVPVGICWGGKTEMGLSSICTCWDEVYDQILRLTTE
jgi:HAD superfamily hydrolase (TIGR01549 family)